MASRDRRDREERRSNRDKNAMAPQQPRGAGSARMNEYFLPKDGIDREVVTADICRYLGNDTLVRPGYYEASEKMFCELMLMVTQNPTTAQGQQGYFITSYRNLTTAMVADLKADSERWFEEREGQKSSSKGNVDLNYRNSRTHMARQYYGPTIDPSTVVSQSHGDNSYIAGSDLKSSSDAFYSAARPLSDGSPKYEGETSTSATSTLPTLSTEGEGTSYGVDSTNLRPPEATRRLGFREQPTINTYGAQTQLLQRAAQSTIADSITRAGIITAGAIGTVGSIGVGSSYYTSRQANAQNEAKFAWEREQAKRQTRLDERESAMERQEQALRERESTFEARERTLQVDLRELEHRVQRREEGIRRREDELNKTNQKYDDWGKELSKIQAEITRSENELKERSEELRRTAMKLREREDGLNRTEKKHVERGKELNKIEAGITRSENELRQRSEKLRAREEEWKRQQQQCHCRHRDPEPISSTSSRPSSTSGNEPLKPDLSIAPLETTKCSTLQPTEQGCNQIDSSPSLADEGFDPDQQSISFSTSIASQPSTAETKTSSQPITMNTRDTESTVSIAAPVPSKSVSSELKAQLPTDTKLDLPDRSPSEDVKKENKPPSVHLTQFSSERESGQEGSGQAREEVIAPENESEHDG